MSLIYKDSLSGTFLNIFGIGTLLMGKPGVGKSELALALIYRNHQLIADDAPIFYKENNKIVGKNEFEVPFLTVRGIGLINIAQIVGPNSFQESHSLDLIIHLERGCKLGESSHLEGIHDTKEFLGSLIPVVTIPIIHCRHLEVLVETIVKSYLVKLNEGYSPVPHLDTLLQRKIGQSHS